MEFNGNRLSFPSLPNTAGKSCREWRDGCWKVGQGHVRSLTGAAVSRRISLRIIHTSLLTLHRAYRKRALLLATASLLAIGAASTGTPALADGGNGGGVPARQGVTGGA